MSDNPMGEYCNPIGHPPFSWDKPILPWPSSPLPWAYQYSCETGPWDIIQILWDYVLGYGLTKALMR